MEVFCIVDIVIAYFIDLLVGDPYWLPHPIRLIGWLVRRSELLLRRWVERKKSQKAERERLAGTILMLLVVLLVSLSIFSILKLAAFINPLLFHVFNIYFIYSAIASKCLALESGKVYKALKSGNLTKARENLSMLVARQTEDLSEKEVIRGVVETTAENTVDGIVSPLFYAVLGAFFGVSAPLVYAFKSISTLDSMVGYMNEKYINFGRTSAKTDDVANFIPARLSGLLIPISALILGMDFKRSFRIMLRDRRNHKSPNCAYPEASVAGALGIMIGGTNVYFGKPVEKPTIGDAEKEIEYEDIKKTVRIMYVTSALTLIIGVLALLTFFRHG